MAEHFASGSWRVRKGKEQEFVERWAEFLQWTRKTQPALGSASLIRDEADPSHFVSFATWPDAESRAAWKGSPEFPEKFRPCRELCEDFYGSDYTREVEV